MSSLESVLVQLHNAWMDLNIVWLEALAVVFLVVVIVPMTLRLCDHPMDSSLPHKLDPPAPKCADRVIWELSLRA